MLGMRFLGARTDALVLIYRDIEILADSMPFAFSLQLEDRIIAYKQCMVVLHVA